MPTHVLLIEDNPGDARFIVEMLKEADGNGFTVECAARLSVGLETLRSNPAEVVLLDLSLPDSQGLETFIRFQSKFPKLPVVILTGTNDEETAVQAAHAGAQDYFVKGTIAGPVLARSLKYAIERKKAQETIRRQGDQYAALISTTSDGYWHFDCAGKLLDVNDTYCQMSGYSRNELLHMRIDDLEGGESHEKLLAHIQQIVAKGFDRFETQHRKKNGELFDVEISATSLQATGQFLSFARDITWRKRAEDALTQAEERMRLAFDAARLGLWDWNLATGGIVLSATARRQMGLPDDSPTNFETFMKSIHPDDRKAMQESIEAAVHDHESHTLEYRRLWPDGSLHWRNVTGRAFCDTTGAPVRVVGVAVDIDERKAADERLLLQVAALQAAANAIAITDGNGTILWTNQAFSQLTGYAPEEALGKNHRLLKSDEHDIAFYTNMWATITAGNVWQGELTNRRKDGSLYTEEMTITPVRVGNGGITHYVAIKQDVTLQRRAEEALRQAEMQYRLLFENNPLPMWVFDSKTLKFLAVNEAAIRQYGFSRQEFLSMTLANIRPEEDVPRLLKAIEQPIHGLREEASLWRHRKKDGSIIDVEIVGHELDFHGVQAELVAPRDVTERKQAERALRRAEEKYHSIFEDAIVGIFQVTPDGYPLSINRSLARMHGYDSPEELMREVSNVQQLFVDPNVLQELARMLEKERVLQNVELEIYNKDGQRKWVSANVRVVTDANGKVILHEGTTEDITARKAAESQAQFLAYYDALTGLPNRTLVRDRMLMALLNARQRGEKVALLYLDLDRFKIINDSLGHSSGDLLLKQVAERLKGWTHKQDTVARLGGDAFLVLLTAIHETVDAVRVAEHVVNSMAAGFVISSSRSLHVTCSLGISIFPDDGEDIEALLQDAELAMYKAKEEGRDRVQLFEPGMTVKATEQMTLESSLRRALERNEFFLVYQPQMDLISNEITGCEALIRWKHPELGLILPNQFIPVAESSGLIEPIGEWVIKTACAQARQWQDEGLPVVPVAVNISAVQFRQEGFLELIKKVLRETGLAPEFLELELTESILLSSTDVMPSILLELKTLGVKLAIDDFGTGYSSFNYLKHFQVHRLKIDRSFVRDVMIALDKPITIA